MTEGRKDTLEERVEKFQTLSLSGQPMMMHMGTAYLVNDLVREVEIRGKIISFLVSVVKSGEPWTESCDEMLFKMDRTI